MNDRRGTQPASHMPDTLRQNPISEYHTFKPQLLLTLPARQKKPQVEETPGTATGTATRISQFKPMHPPAVISMIPVQRPIQSSIINQIGPNYGGWSQHTREVQAQVWNQPTNRFSPVPLAPTAKGANAANSQPTSSQKENVWALLRPWFYRGWLLVTTIALTLLLLWLQGLLDNVPSHQQSSLQVSVRWAELTWLMPVPLALILWAGWFIFAGAVRPAPVPIDVPIVTFDQQQGL